MEKTDSDIPSRLNHACMITRVNAPCYLYHIIDSRFSVFDECPTSASFLEMAFPGISDREYWPRSIDTVFTEPLYTYSVSRYSTQPEEYWQLAESIHTVSIRTTFP